MLPRRLVPLLVLTGCWTLLPAHAHAQDKKPTAAQVEFFEKSVRPILAANCFECHGPDKQKAKLRLDARSLMMEGGDSGPVIVPGNPKASLLIQAIHYPEDGPKMPPKGKLSATEIALLTEWIQQGAPWPETTAPIRAAAKAVKITPRDREFWSFQPLSHPALPAVKHKEWAKTAIDRFLVAALEANGLSPAAPADRRTLIRRVTFDLIGLPPTPEETDAFLKDDAPDAFAKVVDRLLASPQYGEKWARHWLDVARYADSTGRDEDQAYPHAWRYRDYVIDAFNRDLRYDRFVTEQIAGDLLPESERAVVATGFLALGPKAIAQQDRRKMVYDVVDEQIDVTSRAFMGLTVACARCHDHKFDPIRTKDYYSLASIFASTKSFRNYGRPGAVAYLYYAPL